MAVGLGLVALPVLSACGSSGAAGSGDPKTITLVSHNSWLVSKSVLKDFEKQSGYKVRVLKDGDAGQAVNKAILTKDNPQGDVFFGVDNTLLSRALDNGLFQPYTAKGADLVLPRYRTDQDKHRVTPIDTGDICVNYDKAYFSEHKLAPPQSFDDLVKPAYKNLLVTENAATSSPGLGFLLGSAAHYGDDNWQDYWKKLKANGVKVVDGWEQAYNDEFSGSAGGKKANADRPLVVSYASSPPAEVIYAKPKPATAPTGVAAAPASGRSSTRVCSATPRTPRAARRSWTSCSPRSSRTTCRSTCSSTRSVRALRCPRSSRGSVRRPRIPRPWRPRRSPPTATSGSSRGPHSY